MQKNWPKQNIDISVLLQQIIQFFETNKFDITVLKGETDYELLAENSSRYKINETIIVTVEEKRENFSINLELGKEKKREGFRFPVILSTMFGGGYFFLKHLKSEEAWMNFEREFWRQLDNMIARVRANKLSSTD